MCHVNKIFLHLSQSGLEMGLATLTANAMDLNAPGRVVTKQPVNH